MRTFMSGYLTTLILLCGSNTASAELVTRHNTDVQLLQAWVIRQPMVELDYRKCAGNLPAQPHNRTVLDCTDSAPNGRPAAAPWNITVQYDGLGDRYYSPDHAGHTVEIRVVVRRSILESSTFEGIGFYSANLTFQGEYFTRRQDLQVVSTEDVYLASNGEPAVVLRFVLWFPGIQGNSGTGWSRGSVEFKPYAQFSDGRATYMNWEDVAQNHRIYRTENGGGVRQPTSINREREILRQQSHLTPQGNCAGWL
jgi:hypothetical protein